MFDPAKNTPAGIKPARPKYRLPDTKLVYDVGAWTKSLYQREVDEGGALAGLVDTTKRKRGGGDAATVEVLHGEVFGRLYGFGAQKLEEPSTHARDWAVKLHDEAAELPEWKELAHRANGDPWASALATARVGAVLVDKLPALPEDPAPLEAELAGLESLQKAKRWKKLPPRAEKRAQHLKQRLERVSQIAAEATEQLNGSAEQIRIAMRAAASSASKEIEELQGAMEGLGCGKGAGQAEQRKVLRMLGNPAIAKVARLAGRLRRAAIRAQRSKSCSGVSEVVAVELGDDLARLLPTERAMLALGGLGAAMLYSKLVDRRAQQYEVRGVMKDEQGPILFLLDESGSMKTQHGDYTCDDWAKGFALGMMQVAIEQKRAFGMLHYAHDVVREDFFDRPWEVEGSKLLEAIGFFANGGTRTARALERAHEVITSGKWKPGARADVVLLTDGIDYDQGILKAATALRDDAGTHLYTVAIAGAEVPNHLRDASDAVFEATGRDVQLGEVPSGLLAI